MVRIMLKMQTPRGCKMESHWVVQQVVYKL